MKSTKRTKVDMTFVPGDLVKTSDGSVVLRDHNINDLYKHDISVDFSPCSKESETYLIISLIPVSSEKYRTVFDTDIVPGGFEAYACNTSSLSCSWITLTRVVKRLDDV